MPERIDGTGASHWINCPAAFRLRGGYDVGPAAGPRDPLSEDEDGGQDGSIQDLDDEEMDDELDEDLDEEDEELNEPGSSSTGERGYD